MEQKSDGNDSCNWCTWDNPQRLGKKDGRFKKRRTSGHHPDYSIVKIDQNTVKSPGDLRRLAISQTPVKDHQLALV